MNSDWQNKIEIKSNSYSNLDIEPIIERLDKIINKTENLKNLSIKDTAIKIKSLLEQDNKPDILGNIKPETFNKAASLVREHLAEDQDEIFDFTVNQLLSSLKKDEVDNTLIGDLKEIYHDCSTVQILTRKIQYSVWSAAENQKS